MPNTRPVCTKTKPNSLYPWRCQRADQHNGDCKWPIESEHYNLPLEGNSAEWLASEVRALLIQLDDVKRNHRESTARLERRHGVLMRGLIKLAPGNSTRKNVPTTAVRALWQEARG
jgi:hypothetical protein